MKLLWTSLIATPLFAQTAASPDQTATIDSLVRAEMQRQRIPGVAVAVIHRGKVQAKGYGLANLELRLMDRRESGDDRIYVYRVTFANGVRGLHLAIAPDERVAGFSLQRSP
jgi:hypothetical protein